MPLNLTLLNESGRGLPHSRMAVALFEPSLFRRVLERFGILALICPRAGSVLRQQRQGPLPGTIELRVA